jgi:sodium transport system ATP-binding protein
VIHVDQVSRSYGDVRAVSGATFRVEPGEVVGLLGPNGAGKTTILRMLATLLRPDEGRLCVAGFDTGQDPLEVRARIGYLTGDTGLYRRLSPTEFLQYFGRLHSIDESLLSGRVDDLVRQFGISDFADRLCGNLSTGQQQRVSLARTLLNDPPVLILDEPTSGLDIVSSSFVIDALRDAASSGRAVLFSTHIMSEVELVCDRVVVIHRGRVLADATIPELLELTGESQLSHAFLSLVREADGG